MEATTRSGHRAVGAHVFAGGFTLGVKEICDVACQLEVHDFGRHTCEEVVGVPFCNYDSFEKWPDMRGEAAWLFANPRCTGFSCITAGYDDSLHGPWAKQTIDIHDVCQYGVRHGFEAIIWESVQQAYSVGRPLLDHLRDELFVPADYRIAHLFLNAASFGNAQARKRYFFVAYKRDRQFNIAPPQIGANQPTCYDAIGRLRDRECWEGDVNGRFLDYDANTYTSLTRDERAILPHLPTGWNANDVGAYMPHLLPEKMRWQWDNRMSEAPFSCMHVVTRLGWLRPFPTIHSSACRFIHPEFDRPCTVGEIASAMGWGDLIPRGPRPVAQLAKGVVPAVGRWLAEQVVAYLDDEWGDQDWESSYDANRGCWVGEESRGAVEKVFDMTQYVGRHLDPTDYPVPAVARPYEWQAHYDAKTLAKRR